MEQKQELLTLPEAAKVLRVKTSTLRAWRIQRRLPFRKIGGKILLHIDDIQKFIAQSTIPATR
jgi:excisionase family DNA binding protein